MKYYPIYLDIKDRVCLVVGGGAVGARKALRLVKCGAKVKVISDRFAQVFETKEYNGMVLESKAYDRCDLEGIFIVFAATDNSKMNMQIMNDAKACDTLCNIADSQDLSDFILPSVVDRGDLVLAVSTSGASPAMAKQIRQDLENQFGDEYAHFLLIMGQVRKKLLASQHAPEEHKAVFNTLIDNNLLKFVADNDEEQIDKILKDILGEGYTYKNLVSQGR
jgi:precorrin-2 dehydrogenase / sirohydrochlorin ferrochelatase